jgi:hypothetical protein
MVKSCKVTPTKSFAMIASVVEASLRYPGHHAVGNGPDDVADGTGLAVAYNPESGPRCMQVLFDTPAAESALQDHGPD